MTANNVESLSCRVSKISLTVTSEDRKNSRQNLDQLYKKVP